MTLEQYAKQHGFNLLAHKGLLMSVLTNLVCLIRPKQAAPSVFAGLAFPEPVAPPRSAIGEIANQGYLGAVSDLAANDRQGNK